MKTDANTHSGTFVSTRMKSLFVAQEDKPSRLKEINLARLTPFQRGLLVTDGTVTRFIEAYTLMPVEVRRLEQKQQQLTAAHPWLQLPAGAEVISRQVVLETHSHEEPSPVVHAYADSLIAVTDLPKSISEGLASDKQGLGGLLRRSCLETRRELLWCGIDVLTDLPPAVQHLHGKAFISRTYRVFAGKTPLMLISENFPL